MFHSYSVPPHHGQILFPLLQEELSRMTLPLQFEVRLIIGVILDQRQA